jgi:hypothetical protein
MTEIYIQSILDASGRAGEAIKLVREMLDNCLTEFSRDKFPSGSKLVRDGKPVTWEELAPDLANARAYLKEADDEFAVAEYNKAIKLADLAFECVELAVQATRLKWKGVSVVPEA